MFRIANNKLFEWLFSRVLASPGPGHVITETSSLGWRGMDPNPDPSDKQIRIQEAQKNMNPTDPDPQHFVPLSVILKFSMDKKTHLNMK
jgi:hypothetical protein